MMLFSIAAQDSSLMIFLNTLGSTFWDPFWLLVSSKWIWIPLYGYFVFLLYKVFGPKGLLYALVFALIGITLSDQLATLFKEGFKRLRPCHSPIRDQLRIVTCGGQYGFYSAHSSNCFFLAVFLSRLFRGKAPVFFSWFLFIWASVVAYSRIYLGVHYPLDVVYGALMGGLLGGLFSDLWRRAVSKNAG